MITTVPNPSVITDYRDAWETLGDRLSSTIKSLTGSLLDPHTQFDRLSFITNKLDVFVTAWNDYQILYHHNPANTTDYESLWKEFDLRTTEHILSTRFDHSPYNQISLDAYTLIRTYYTWLETSLADNTPAQTR